MGIAVAGGTGHVGTHVVEVARDAGHDVVVLARSRGVDVRTGAGLSSALKGVDVVIDVANVTTTSEAEAVEFFSTTTRNLLDAGTAAGVRHHVALSIVGVDRAPSGYYAGKVAQEKLVEAAAVPWTLLRATQFHEFAGQMYAQAKLGPIHFAPKARTRPIAAREVAAHLVDCAVAGPAGRATEVAGPREESLADMVRAYARAKGSRAWIPSIPLPGPFGRAMRDGSLLPGADAVLGRQTFAEWVDGVRP